MAGMEKSPLRWVMSSDDGNVWVLENSEEIIVGRVGFVKQTGKWYCIVNHEVITGTKEDCYNAIIKGIEDEV